MVTLTLGTAPGARPREHPGGDVDHMRALYVQTPATLAGYALGAAVVSALFTSSAEPLRLWGWLAVLTLLWSLRLAHYLRYLRHPEADDATLLAWRGSWRVLVVMQGSLWGIAPWLFWDAGNPYDRLALVLVVYSYCVSSVQLLATQARVFTAFIAVVLTPTIARIASDTTEPGHLMLAAIVAILFAATGLMARTYGSALAQAIALKARTDELAAQLRDEKLQAEAARQAAEQARVAAEQARQAAEAASLAKTQFFAAASHDLRQPLHAMGLFAEALRQRVRDPEVASLVNSINESVDALEGLFAELLDLTRLDAGTVEVDPQPVRLQDVFSRLRLHFEPSAFEKGLLLSLRGGERVVQADPVLLDRVLRNLVSNAIRYTDDGGVLVSARARGDRVLLQVWDTGCGIAATDLSRIFDEFIQVRAPGSSAPGPQRRKGLGLGLAIVRRMAVLMGCEVRVASRPGRGTVFSLLLPRGTQARTARAQADDTTTGPALTLAQRRVLVVEDDAAVREGLQVLLRSWQADVTALESLSQVQAWLEAVAASALAPDVLLVDYRLPDGHTGVDVIQAVRARWPARRLPAIVVTGSNLVGHEDEALRHDYHLLTKPVSPNRLRAMISFKLGMRPAARDHSRPG